MCAHAEGRGGRWNLVKGRCHVLRCAPPARARPMRNKMPSTVWGQGGDINVTMCEGSDP